jgi:hypothetical protein
MADLVGEAKLRGQAQDVNLGQQISAQKGWSVWRCKGRGDRTSRSRSSLAEGCA